ncbi:hypothetical protein A2Z22_03675 [Candidatus Woesebacteria bacterium RBG_16_34_12]|uniref:Uncharacterized protein n=1 Tax=Candidatus Woesebacteria bacterium RBG_16_34_12 TaxID=1802480 RepID=A0A1F7X819_9BACT|nr:MAG: hypothetical protein A2Z22_03675 [Candidatus Woesebacteria bacterium RBG_16_34_12]
MSFQTNDVKFYIYIELIFGAILSKRRWGATPDPGEAPPLAEFNIQMMLSLASFLSIKPFQVLTYPISYLYT